MLFNTLPLVVIAFIASTIALPSYSRTTARYEPLFKKGSAGLGPSKALERLRLRRRAANYSAQRIKSQASNIKSKPIQNPKLSKRSFSGKVFNGFVGQITTIAVNPTNPKFLVKKDSIIINPKLIKRELLIKLINATTQMENDEYSTLPLVTAAVPGIPWFTNPKNSNAIPKPLSTIISSFLPSPTTSPILSLIPIPIPTTLASISISSSVPATPSSSSIQVPTTTMVSITPTLTSMSSIPMITSSSEISTSTMSTSTSMSSSTALSSITSSRTSTSSAAMATGTQWPTSGGLISATYFADWEGDITTPASLDYSKLDLIDFAFAVPTADFDVTFTQSNSGDLLTDLVTRAHAANTKVMISIGGWTGSNYFSKATSTAANREIFIKNIVKMVKQYNVDGVDLDWEYPGTSGATNDFTISDTANFLTFLKALKKQLPVTANRLSSCVSHNAFIGADGSPIADVSAFSDVLDNILIMNYDVWGASSNPGPNAPLSNDCSNSQQPNANELSSIQTWTTAGMPASKILMGVPAYGYISSSSATKLVHKRSINNRERAMVAHVESTKSAHRRWTEAGLLKRVIRDTEAKKAKRAAIIFCPNNHSGKPCEGIIDQNITTSSWSPLSNGTTSTNGTTIPGIFSPGRGIGKLGNGDVSTLSGNQIEWRNLISYAVIALDDNGNYVGINGYTRAWDSCSSTPYLYDQSRNIVITYDDPSSLYLKGQMALAQKIGGVNMWDIGGDSIDFTLTNAWRAGMGLN